MLIFVLIVFLTILLYAAYFFMNKELMSPPVLFIGPFLIATIFAAVYREFWKLDLHLNTFLVLFGGCFVCLLACISYRYSSFGRRTRARAREQAQKTTSPEQINISTWKVVAFVLVQIISVFTIAMDMRKLTSQYGISGNFSTVMYWFRHYHMFSEDKINLSSLASNLRMISVYGSYIWIYTLCHNKTYKYKTVNAVWMLVSVILSVVCAMMVGARGDAFDIFVAIFVMFFALWQMKGGRRHRINFRKMAILVAAVTVALFSFKALGDMAGRNAVESSKANSVTNSAIYTMAFYFGAEIKNLDIYLAAPFHRGAEVFGGQTFAGILGWLSGTFGLGWNVEVYLPFQSGGTGNVYSTFYPFIYDFGYTGVVVLTAILAVVSQMLYERSKLNGRNTAINFNMLIYSYISGPIVFSFFGEAFFTSILSTGFIKVIFLWKFMIWYCLNMKTSKQLTRSKTLEGK